MIVQPVIFVLLDLCIFSVCIGLSRKTQLTGRKIWGKIKYFYTRLQMYNNLGVYFFFVLSQITP